MTLPSSPSATVSHVVALSSEFLDGLESTTLSYCWAGLICLVVFIVFKSTRPQKYDSIPAIGRTGFVSSYLDVISYIMHGPDVLAEAYIKYRPRMFRVPELLRWHIIVTGPQQIDELRKAPDDVLSFKEATKESLASDWTLGPGVAIDPYHIPIIRSQLTRNIGNFLADLRQEVVLAFDDNIPVTEDWTSVKVLNTSTKIISRVSNRIFVGAPLCRDPEFIELNIKFTMDVVVGAKAIALFPDFLKPLAGRLLTNVPKSIGISLKYLKPLIDERMQKIEEYGPDYPGKPLDMLSWLMDEAQGEERTPENLTRRILTVNFAAIHTSSMSFTRALFDLASRPEYIEPIRQEVEAVVAEEGWTKVAINRMRKLDSFIKESQRMKGLGFLSMTRKALKEFTFSDGTRIPKGTTVSTISTPRHLDDEVYPDAKTFNGFRFSDMQHQEGGDGAKNQLVVTSNDFLQFGHGRHACPGRFFAANELKTMMAHILLTYDFKMTDVPRDRYFASSVIPDSEAGVWFRKRRV